MSLFHKRHDRLLMKQLWVHKFAKSISGNHHLSNCYSWFFGSGGRERSRICGSGKTLICNQFFCGLVEVPGGELTPHQQGFGNADKVRPVSADQGADLLLGILEEVVNLHHQPRRRRESAGTGHGLPCEPAIAETILHLHAPGQIRRPGKIAPGRNAGPARHASQHHRFGCASCEIAAQAGQDMPGLMQCYPPLVRAVGDRREGFGGPGQIDKTQGMPGVAPRPAALREPRSRLLQCCAPAPAAEDALEGSPRGPTDPARRQAACGRIARCGSPPDPPQTDD